MPSKKLVADVEPPPAEAEERCKELSPPKANTPDAIALAAAEAAAEYRPCQLKVDILLEYIEALRKHGVVKPRGAAQP